MNEKTMADIACLAAQRWNLRPKQFAQGLWEHVAQAVIEAHESRKWQSIESAPLIQDVLTATNGKDVCVAKKSFYTYNPDNLFFGTAAGLKISPTHWQPLPVPPKQECES